MSRHGAIGLVSPRACLAARAVLVRPGLINTTARPRGTPEGGNHHLCRPRDQMLQNNPCPRHLNGFVDLAIHGQGSSDGGPGRQDTCPKLGKSSSEATMARLGWS
ncbi:uncharacterized protein B0I36DRAFT_320360 [Microdochium trichocladiopsis]|uniref:Uncharacterized protein n=1 Tax=Microdochium trichocladiopsis TaxID=1682393 RepID=A0A9P8Y886_9PEZI|nr:uncharacterized protein B0I36DRAFT_320360 [Microdochium trichocladiopsis]KAH7032927.1 hypothetical protein B0I36DRAFT_320360 [Microdochium trichocladiopsis]